MEEMACADKGISITLMEEGSIVVVLLFLSCFFSFFFLDWGQHTTLLLFYGRSRSSPPSPHSIYIHSTPRDFFQIYPAAPALLDAFLFRCGAALDTYRRAILCHK
jgi:hypothetical protein